MDPASLANSAVAFLAPYLVQFAMNAADRAAAQLPEQVGKLWNLVKGKITGKPAAEGAFQELADNPNDPDNQEAVILQLRKILKEDPQFAEQLGGLIKTLSDAAGVVNLGNGAVATGGSTAAGAGGIAVGGNVGGSVILGSNNTVHPGSQR